MQIWNIQILLFVFGIQIFSIPNSILYLVFGDILKPNSIRYSYLVFKSICHILPKTQMSHKLKGYQNWNIFKTEIPSKLKCHWNQNVTEQIYHLNWKITKTEIELYNWAFKFDSRSLALIAFALLFFFFFRKVFLYFFSFWQKVDIFFNAWDSPKSHSWLSFYHGPNVSRAMVIWPPNQDGTH